MEDLSELLAQKLIIRNVIKSNHKELFKYGLRNIYILMINILSSIIIGLIYKKLAETLILLITFIPLRSYAGGFHFRNKVACYFASNIVIVIAINSADIICVPVLWIISICTEIFIYYKAPIDGKVRRYDNHEKQYFNNKAKKILFLENIAYIIGMNVGIERYIKYILIAIILAGILCLGGLLLNSLRNLNKNLE